MPAYKTCCKCKETKPINDFSRDRTRRDGVRVYCKHCQKASHRIYYQGAGKEVRERYKKKYYATETGKLVKKMCTARWRRKAEEVVREEMGVSCPSLYSLALFFRAFRAQNVPVVEI